jgi:pSer/pThr/pTyr-binding forkhead associated (FHA) protein
MSRQKLGELVPVGGGDPIPLYQDVISIGRRESCDICLKYQNISSQHCELVFSNGRWTIKDLKSSNGVKVNGGERLIPHSARVLRPGDEISVATHKFTIVYEVGANVEELMVEEEDLFSRSLMEKAGLEKPKDRD